VDITIDGARFYAVEVGAGRGEPLVALHGGPGLDHRELRPYLDPLGDVARVVYLDQRGQGRSERVAPETCTTDRMIDDVEGLRRHLGAERVAVLGHSFGGFIALGYAERYPERVSRLVLSCTAPSHEMAVEAAANVEQYATPEQRAALESEGGMETDEQMCDILRAELPYYFHRYDDSIRAEAERWIDETIYSARMSSWWSGNEFPHYDLRPGLGRVAAPALIIAGQHDRVCSLAQAEIMHKGIAGSHLTVMEYSAHSPYLEEPDAYLWTVRQFLLGQPVGSR